MSTTTNTATANTNKQPSTTTTTPTTNTNTAGIFVGEKTPYGFVNFLLDRTGLKNLIGLDSTFLSSLQENTFSKNLETNPEYEAKYELGENYYKAIASINFKVKDLQEKIQKIGTTLGSAYLKMVQNLIKVQIYSYYDKKKTEAPKESEPVKDNKEEYEKMITDIIALVNQSLDQSNAVFENRLRNQSGGSMSDSKIDTMSKYFKYKLKYMIVKNQI
tara:strand:- start:637 stop:1287 length:651 start_codon:yes stop_codon:yes gene_type:complete